MKMTYKALFLFATLFVASCAQQKQWWPYSCNSSDTAISKGDTIITKYHCKNNGRKEILSIKNGKYHGPYIAWSSNGAKIEDFTYYED